MRFKIPEVIRKDIQSAKPDDLVLYQVAAVSILSYLVKKGVAAWYYERLARKAEEAEPTEDPDPTV